jgi:hypothetical protein
VMRSIGLGSLPAGWSLHPTRQHVGILLSRIGAVNIVFQPRTTLHVFSTLLESARTQIGPPKEIDQ